jgi:hypothetical protein
VLPLPARHRLKHASGPVKAEMYLRALTGPDTSSGGLGSGRGRRGRLSPGIKDQMPHLRPTIDAHGRRGTTALARPHSSNGQVTAGIATSRASTPGVACKSTKCGFEPRRGHHADHHHPDRPRLTGTLVIEGTYDLSSMRGRS